MGREFDDELFPLLVAIAQNDYTTVRRSLQATPQLARGGMIRGATRACSERFFLSQIQMQVVAGVTALHVAAAAYQADIVRELVALGANVSAQDRLKCQPIHLAATGSPGSTNWNPAAQVATIGLLIELGADSSAVDKRGVTPLHRAVRTRCAGAVAELLSHGADARKTNHAGSTPLRLANLTTGRSGSGSIEALEQQAQIVEILNQPPHK